jgi:hypothetical protein
LAPFIDIRRERIGDRRFGGLHRAAVATGFAGAHHRPAHALHDRFDVGEVEVDQAFLDDQVGDAADAGIEHAVGDHEGIGKRGLGIGDAEEVLVGNDDDGIGSLAQRLDAFLGRSAYGGCPRR